MDFLIFVGRVLDSLGRFSEDLESKGITKELQAKYLMVRLMEIKDNESKGG